MMGTIGVGLNAFLHYEMAISLWGPGREMWWLERTWPPQGVALLEGVTLLE